MISRLLLSLQNTGQTIFSTRLLTLMFFLFTFSLLHAQWLTTPDSSLLIGYGLFPEIVSDEDGGAIVAFEATTPSNEQVIKVKRVDKFGYLQWNGFSGVIAGGTGDEQHEHSIWEDGSGGVFVAFEDRTCDPDCGIPTATIFSKVRVQQIDHAGNKLWGDGIAVTLTDSIRQREPQVQPDGEGGCIVSWMDNRHSPDPLRYDVYVQRIDSSGNLCWGDSGIALTDSANLVGTSTPYMVVDEQGIIFLMYWDGSDFRLQRINRSGMKLWSDSGFVMNQTPAIRMPNGNGGVIAASAVSDNGIIRLACQNIDSTGQKLWGPNGVILADTVNVNYSLVTGLLFDDMNNLFVSYTLADILSQSETYIQKIDPNGVKLFGENGIPPSLYPSNKRGIITPSESNILCLWNDLTRQGYYIQKLDVNGNILWNEDILFSLDGSFWITHDGEGGIIMVDWGGDTSIKLTKISKNGVIGEVITSIQSGHTKVSAERFILYQNYPNPFNPSTTIRFQLSIVSDVKLKIYDISGQEINTLTSGRLPAGNHEILWEGVDNHGKPASSGVYFYTLNVDGNIQVKKMLLIR